MAPSFRKTGGNASTILTTERLTLTPSAPGADIGPWAVVESATGLRVGTIGFFGREPDGALVVGYEIANERRGHGFATEALCAVLEQAHDAVIAETQADHVASRRVMEKAGMRLFGVDVDRARVRYTYDRAVPSTP